MNAIDSMNWLDFVFFGIIILSVIISLFRGLIREVLSLFIWLAAFWVAYNFVNVGASSLERWIELPSARHLIAFVGLFISALIVGGMVNFIVGKLISKTGLSATDRFFGMFFGALRAIIVIVSITFFIKATPFSEDPWWQESKLAPQFSKISEWVRLKMPEEFSQYFSFIDKDSHEGSSPQEKIKEVFENLSQTINNNDQSSSEDN